MARQAVELNASRTSAAVNLNFTAEYCWIHNPTATAIYFRQGSPEIPTASFYDFLVPSGAIECIPVRGANFGVALANPSALSTLVVGSTALANRVGLIFTQGEAVPTFGALSYQTLSTSELTTGLPAFASSGGTATFGPYDLSLWGGALVFVKADVSDAQGYARVDVSADASAWTEYGRWAVWGGMTWTLQLPRAARYFRVTFVLAGINATVLSGVINVRATLAEVLQVAFSPQTASATATAVPVAFGGGLITALTLCTIGFPAAFVTATLAGALNTRITIRTETSDALAGNWSVLNASLWNPSQGIPTFGRNFPDLDQFTRIRLYNNDSGTVNVTVRCYGRNNDNQTGALSQLADVVGSIYDVPANAMGFWSTFQNTAAQISNINTVNGSPTDTYGSLTVYGQLLRIQQEQFYGMVKVNTSGNNLAVGAAVWTLVPIVDLTGYDVVAAAIATDNAAVSKVAMRFGNGAGINFPIIWSGILGGGQQSIFIPISMADHRLEINNTYPRLWVYSTLACNIEIYIYVVGKYS